MNLKQAGAASPADRLGRPLLLFNIVLLKNNKNQLTNNTYGGIIAAKEGCVMKHTDVRALSRFVYALVSAVFVLNLLVLPLVPGLVAMKGDGLAECGRLSLEVSLPAPAVFLLVCWQYLWRIWRMGSYDVVLTVFLLFCGGCTAVILWQGRRVLGAIAKQTPFCRENGVSLRRAAVCCFLISGAAALRVCWGFWYYRSILPLLTYNALFVPLFLMAGLLCMVMSALFRQAAQLKEENDLTI